MAHEKTDELFDMSSMNYWRSLREYSDTEEFRDYVQTEGDPGGFGLQLDVYGREGEPCPTCASAIRREVLAQRSTYWCPKCQR